MSTKKTRTLIPRKLKLLPAAALSIVLMAILSLLGLLNFNPPSLNDDSQDASETETESTDDQALVSAELLQQPMEASESTDSSDSNETSEEETVPLQPLDIVDVLIDGDDFLFAIGDRDGVRVRESKTVAEIVDAVKAAPGDAAGVKIRITRTFEATAQAERTLITALQDAGLSDDDIDQRRTLVDSDGPSSSE